MKTFSLKHTVLVVSLLAFSTTASAGFWFFLPWLVGGAKVVAVKTVVIGKTSALILTKQSVAVTSLAKAGTITGKSIVVGAKSIPVAAVGTLVVGAGFVSAGSRDIDEMVLKEIAAAKDRGLESYTAKVCKRGDEHYAIPTDAKVCLDGLEPLMAKDPLDLSKLQDLQVRVQ